MSFRLTVALALDLQSEFEPYFKNIIKAIRNVVLESKSPEVIEASYQCVAKLFNCMKAQVVSANYDSYLKLMSSFWDPNCPNYSTKFSVQATAGVFRKVWNKYPKHFFRTLSDLLKKNISVSF